MFEAVKTKEQLLKAKDRVIVALDVETAIEARTIIAELRNEVGAFKIGLQLFTSAGASFVREQVASDIKVFLDVKFHDIPNTVSKAAIEVARLGVWMFNVHALGGGEMMRKTVMEVREFCEKENLIQPKIIGVTVLTSANREILHEIGINSEVPDAVLTLAQLAAKCGLDGVVASPREVKLIRGNIARNDFLIVTPGIRNAKSDGQNPELNPQRKNINRFETNDDQKRVMMADEAVQAGSDYLVIGRPILHADNKISAVREIVKQIEASAASS